MPKSLRNKVVASKKARFGMIGIINTIVDFSLLFVLATLVGLPALMANIISTSAALTLSYVLNKRAVFRDADTHNARQFVLFIVVTLCGLWFIQGAVILVANHVIETWTGITGGLALLAAKGVASLFSLVWNYLWYSRVVFAKRKLTLKPVIRALTRRWRLVALGATLTSLVIAGIMGMGRSVWFDEGYSIMLADRPVAEMVELTKVDAHPPGYYLYLKAWSAVFGQSEQSLRLSSMLPGALAVFVMIAVIRRLFDAKAAIAVAPFLAFAPLLARYNYEIRMYSMVALLTALGTWLLLKARESKSRRFWLLYALIVVASMYVFYMSAVIWLAHALWLVYEDVRVRKNPILRQHWLYYGLSALLFIPWIPTVLYQLHNTAAPPNMADVGVGSFVNVLFIMSTNTPLWDVNYQLFFGLLAVVALVGWLLLHMRRSETKKQWSGIVLLLITFASAIALYWYISLPPNPPRLVERYMVHVSLFFYALIGTVVYFGYRARMHWLALGLAGLCFVLFTVGLCNLYERGNYNFQRLQSAYAKSIKQEVGCGDTAIVASGAYGYVDMWYDFQGCDFSFYAPTALPYVGGFAPVNALNETKRVASIDDVDAPRIAFISYDDSGPPLDVGDEYTLERTIIYPGVNVEVYDRK